jgi:hypothetical protein
MIGTGFSDYIGTRTKAGQTAVEFYNKQNPQQLAFGNPGELVNFAKTISGNNDINEGNVFEVIKQGFTPISPGTPPTATITPDLPRPTATDTTSTYVTSLTADLDAKRKTVEDAYNKQLETIRTQQADYQKKIDEFKAKQTETLEQDIQPLLQPFQENMEKSERERLKVEENFFANQALTEELQTLLTQGNELIKQAQTRSGPLALMSRRTNQVMSDIAARAGVLEATLAARNNQIAQAYTLIDRSVEATVADRQDRLKYFSTLLDFYENQKDEAGNKLLDLDKEERAFVSAQIGLLEGDLANAQKTADYLKSLMIDPETAKFVSDAGVTLNDSIEIINRKMAEQTKRIEAQNQQKANREEAFNAAIKTQFYRKNGEWVRTADGFAFESPAQFQQMTGMTTAEAEAKGLVSELSLNTTAEREQVLDLMSKYWDAGITPGDSLATATEKAKRSGTYQQATTKGGGSNPSMLQNSYIVDKNTDAAVRQILASRPGDGGYGDAYDAVKNKLGEVVARKYDKIYQYVFNQGANVDAAFNNVLLSTTPQSEYRSQTNDRILQSVNDLLPNVNSSTVGIIGKASYKIPGSAAYNFNAQLETLKSNIAFGALTQMREASKTGGALGQVSDREGKLLESSLAALDIGQSPQAFKEQLEKIRQSLERWNAAANGETQPTDNTQRPSLNSFIR